VIDKIKDLGRRIRKGLRSDRRQRMERVSDEIQSHLVAGRVHEAYATLRTWYKDVGARASKPVWRDLEQVHREYQSLYSADPPSGDSIRINVTPYNINDEAPSETEIIAALKRMRRGKKAGLSQIKVEDLIYWQEFKPDMWAKVLDLVNRAFTGRPIPEALARGILVLIPKSTPNKFRAIGLLEVIYKLCSTIIHIRLSDAIEFHPSIHGFRPGRSTCTAIIEAKLHMQLAMRKCEPFFQVFLDIEKAYDSVDRACIMKILEGYGVGPNLRHFIQWFWDYEDLIPKIGGYFGKHLHAERGVCQGDTDSPTIFDIVLDCILREWYRQTEDIDAIVSLFYADDGDVGSSTAAVLQKGLNRLGVLFAQVGWRLNVDKTKAMTTAGGKPYLGFSEIGYKRRFFDSSLPNSRARKRAKVMCQLCGKSVCDQYLSLHLRQLHPSISIPAAESPYTLPGRSYSISVPRGQKRSCPVSECPYSAKRTRLSLHFAFRHPQDVLHIEENASLQQCPQCGKYLRTLTQTHLSSNICRRLATRRQALAIVQKQYNARSIRFYIDGQEIETVQNFIYLGRVLDDQDRDDTAVFARLAKARARWGRIGRVLSSSRANPRCMARFYLAVLQSVLLYGSETWVLSPVVLRRLQSFHHRCARYISHKHGRQLPDGTWVLAHSATALEIAGLSPITTYIAKRKTTLLNKVAAEENPLYQQCLASRSLAAGRSRRTWWLNTPSSTTST